MDSQCMSQQQEQTHHKNPSSRCLAEGNRIWFSLNPTSCSHTFAIKDSLRIEVTGVRSKAPSAEGLCSNALVCSAPAG